MKFAKKPSCNLQVNVTFFRTVNDVRIPCKVYSLQISPPPFPANSVPCKFHHLQIHTDANFGAYPWIFLSLQFPPPFLANSIFLQIQRPSPLKTCLAFCVSQCHVCPFYVKLIYVLSTCLNMSCIFTSVNFSAPLSSSSSSSSPMNIWKQTRAPAKRSIVTEGCHSSVLLSVSNVDISWPPGEFRNPQIFPQSGLGRRADSRWASLQISSYFCWLHIRDFLTLCWLFDQCIVRQMLYMYIQYVQVDKLK